MNLVVGSGPAGVAAAAALLARGQRVTLLDTGLEIDPEAADLRELARREPEPVRRALATAQYVARGLPMKTLFGSDFPYRSVPGFAALDMSEDADVLMSYAQGGLSNLWGANALPFTRAELASWPVPHSEMEAAYRAVMPLLPLSAERDPALEARLPLYTDQPQPRPLSRQAAGMLADLTRHREALAAEGVLFGASRLAVTTEPRDGTTACSRCGFCLDGCPDDLIYNAAHTLEQLRRDPRFRYLPGHYVSRYEDHSDHVRVVARTQDGEQLVFVADRLYIGCGALSSARLVMESLGRFNEAVRMPDSCYFIQPWLRWRATQGVMEERLQTLSQLCLRLDEASAEPAHILIYTYNDLLRRRLEASPLRVFPWLGRLLLERMVVAQGYLHSNSSPALEARIIAPTNAQASPVIQVRALPNPRTAPALRRVRRILGRAAWRAHATPLPGTLIVGRPGKGYHFGGGFPMRANPKDGESDTLGRPFGAARVHLIDSSCFPDIPATNLTLTVMANAWRIASESSVLSGGDARA